MRQFINTYIYKNKPHLVKLFFRRKGKKHIKDRKSKHQILNRRMIDERPANVERKSGKLIATKLPNKCSQSVLEGTGMTVYFARAYAFWQKGTNESTNGLLRQFIPKGTDFDTVSDEDLQRYVNLINNRPRKRHQWLTPNQVFEQGLNMCRASV